MDLVAEIKNYPIPDSKVEADQMHLHPGGPAFTAAAFLAWRGFEVHFCGVVGSDPWGDYLQKEMRQRNICFHRPDGDVADGTNLALVWVETETAKRTILWKNTGDLQALRTLPEEAYKTLRESDLLYLDGHGGELVVEAVAIAVEEGIPIFYDGGSAKTTDLRVLPMVDFLVVSERFASQYFHGMAPKQVMAEMAERWGPFRQVGLTLGKEGSWGQVAGKDPRFFPAPKVESIDTNGAGDIFHAVLAQGVMQGWSTGASWREATRLAAESTMVRGGGVAWVDLQFGGAAERF